MVEKETLLKSKKSKSKNLCVRKLPKENIVNYNQLLKCI